MNIGKLYLVKKLEEIADQDIELAWSSSEQELQVIALQRYQDALLYTQINNQNNCYLVRRFPLVNPVTHDGVGLLIIMIKIDILNVRKILSTRILNRTQNSSIIVNKQFSEKESLITACLLPGFHKRKDIAQILEKSTQNDVSDIQVRNSLQKLYERFNCNSTIELIEFICSHEDSSYNLPAQLNFEKIISLN